MLKKLSLILCVTLLILLAACKQDKAPGDNTISTPSDVQSNSQNTSSGTELEEDVFDDSDITSTPSGDNVSNNNLSSNEGTSSNEQTPDYNSSTDNTTSDNISGDDVTDQNPDQEDSNQSKDEVVVDDDGTIKLPIDKFN